MADKTAVDAVFVGRNRAYNRRFQQMCGHYPVWYCNLKSGNSLEVRAVSPSRDAPREGRPILVFHGVSERPWRRTNGQAEGYGG